MNCPFANPDAPIEDAVNTSGCPFHAHTARGPGDFEVDQGTELDILVRGGTHHPSPESALLLKDIGGPDKIREMCTRFYSHGFRDVNTKQFFFLDDGAEAHGKRLADWIIEKMDKNDPAWTRSGRYGQRQPSHHAAWNSHKRSPENMGKHFDLKDTRIWMRLHFYACIETGLADHKPFFRYYQQFIGHFVAVYERQAPRYVEESVKWAQNRQKFEQYCSRGFIMEDADSLGVGPRMLDLLAERGKSK
jgi:hypothetical protein